MTTNKPTPTTHQSPRQKQMSFKQFRASKHGKQKPVRNANSTKPAQSELTEQTIDLIDADVRNSLFASIPAQASNSDIAIELLADKFREMTKTMDIVVTCVGFGAGE
jgi:hypothetical protein